MRAFAVLACTGILWSASAAPTQGQAVTEQAAGRSLRIITDFDSPPFSYREAGEPRGFEIDLGLAVGKELGRDVEWIKRSFDVSTIASALNAGSADAAMMSISITEKRERQLSFSAPYYHSGLSLAVQSDVNWTSNTFTSGMRHWEIGVLRGSTAERWARENLAGKVKTFYSADRMVQALKNSKAHKVVKEVGAKDKAAGFAILLDHEILMQALSKYGYRFQIVEQNINPEEYGIAVKKGNDALLGEINGALEKLDLTGAYDAIYEKWFGHRADLPKVKVRVRGG